MSTTFVLIHGSFCNAAVWGPLARELTLRGHRTIAVDLPGHGLGATVPAGYLGAQDLEALAGAPSGLAGIGTADDVALVGAVVERVAEHGPVVLVGHSRGGLTATAVANRLPHLLRRVVFISAWCPSRRTVSQYQQLPEMAESLLAEGMRLLVGDPARIGALRLNWRSTEPADLELFARMLDAQGSRDQLLAYLQLHEPDESIIVDERATRVNPGSWSGLAHSYLRLTQDRAMPLAAQDRFIADADELLPDNRFDVHSLPGGHVGFQLRPAAAAEVLHRLA